MKKDPSSRHRDIRRQWVDLMAICSDAESQRRLMFLQRQMERCSEMDAASSLAEVEMAHFLSRAGFSVSFLEAGGGRTADLQCYDGSHRFFVEVTVIQSAQGLSHAVAPTRSAILLETGDDFFEQAFVKRLLARMAEKTKQLERYCAPVLLAVSIPDLLTENRRKTSLWPLDLQRLAGMVVGILAEAPQFSGLLLTFWNTPAQKLRNPIRIRQVHWVTRPFQEGPNPRIRLLVANSFARYPMMTREIRMIRDVL